MHSKTVDGDTVSNKMINVVEMSLQYPSLSAWPNGSGRALSRFTRDELTHSTVRNAFKIKLLPAVATRRLFHRQSKKYYVICLAITATQKGLNNSGN
jgi:hypothetical protein